MVDTKVYRPILIILCAIFGLLILWWLTLVVIGDVNQDTLNSRLWGAAYGLVAIVGGLYGIYAARGWGFLASYLGGAVIALSAGLLLQEFGQLVFSYYNIVEKIEIPYPSIADIGFFGAIPAYILGAVLLMKGLGVVSLIKKHPAKLLIGIIAPLVILGITYWLFLKDYDATDKDTLTIFLDFGYPLGQAIYVSLAVVVASSLRGMLGGVMKWPIILLLVAFALQYVADFNFLYQAYQATWMISGYGDVLYLVAYFAMGASLIFVNRGLSKVFVSNSTKKETV